MIFLFFRDAGGAEHLEQHRIIYSFIEHVFNVVRDAGGAEHLEQLRIINSFIEHVFLL